MKKKNMPASMGGIVQYYDESASKTSFTPKQVIVITVLLVLVVLLLKWTNMFSM